MVGLLTWPAYGTWLAGGRRGWIDRGAAFTEVPEPTRHGRTAKWVPVRLDAAQRAVIGRDLTRVAALRGFRLLMTAVAEDHVHVLLALEPNPDVVHLVQLIKGASARALTVAAGDQPPRTTSGQPLPHHKWWTRQYSFVPITNKEALGSVTKTLSAHEDALCLDAGGQWTTQIGL